MTHRTSSGGSFRIDRRFRGIGRIALASGTTKKAIFEKYNAMLTELFEDGRTDVLAGIKTRRWTLQHVYQARRNGRLPYLASELSLQDNLWSEVEKWIPRSARAKASRQRYAVSFKSLRRSGVLSGEATISDLRATDWFELLKAWLSSGADWNRLRSAVSRFLTMTLGDKYHPFRREVMTAFPRAKESPGRVPDLDTDLLWQIIAKTPEHVRPAYVTLAVTGLRPGEYLALEETDLLHHTQSIRVPGSKTPASADVIRVGPVAWKWVRRAVPPPLRYKWLYTHWKRACTLLGAPDLTLHDLRHFYAQQLTEAGRSEVSVQHSLRHTDPNMTRRYTRQKDRGENALKMDEILFPLGERSIAKGA